MPHDIYQKPETKEPIRQGEIFTQVPEITKVLTLNGEAEKTTHAYAIVVTQECDLTQDAKQRKPDAIAGENSARLLRNIMFCRVEEATLILSEIKRNAGNSKSSTLVSNFYNNDDFRYHYLEEIPAESDYYGEKLPDLGVDFRYCFTIPIQEVYSLLDTTIFRRRTILRPVFKEHLSLRYHYFHSRVGLPRDHGKEAQE